MMLNKLGAATILLPKMAHIPLSVSKIGFHMSKPHSEKMVEKVENNREVEKVEDKPIKFTTSEAHVNYTASRNFYGDDRDLPKSHNMMLTVTGILSLFYLIILRDDIEGDGGVALLQPVHEQLPQFAIPMLQAAIAENRRLGYSTAKLEKKLNEYMKDPEHHGGYTKKLVEN